MTNQEVIQEAVEFFSLANKKPDWLLEVRRQIADVPESYTLIRRMHEYFGPATASAHILEFGMYIMYRIAEEKAKNEQGITKQNS